MDFSLDDNEWDADPKTDILCKEILELNIPIKKKSRKRRLASENKEKLFHKTKRCILASEDKEEITEKLILKDNYPKTKTKKKRRKFISEKNQVSKNLEESKQVICLKTKNSLQKHDLDCEIVDFPSGKSNKEGNRKKKAILYMEQKKTSVYDKKREKKHPLKKKLPSEKNSETFIKTNNRNLSNSVTSSQCKSSVPKLNPVRTFKKINSVKILPNVEKLKHIFSSELNSKVPSKLELSEMKKDVTKSGIFILEKEKRKLFSNALKESAIERLRAAKFRYINEKIYTSNSKEAFDFFKSDPTAFQLYHDGFNGQICKWPLNPVDVIIQDIQKRSKKLIIADFGCGNAKIAQIFSDRVVHSFDLFSLNEYVTACDMANVPLKNESVDIAVFCLALMGTNLNDYLCEAHRVLKMNGILKIAEVISRIDDTNKFINDIKEIGFSAVHRDINHKMFIFLDFKKTKKVCNRKLPIINLKPCLYKKR